MARDILAFANAVSALKCTPLGGRAGIPRQHEVHAFLIAQGKVRITNLFQKERKP